MKYRRWLDRPGPAAPERTMKRRRRESWNCVQSGHQPRGTTSTKWLSQPRRRRRIHHSGDRQSGGPGQATSKFGPYYESQIYPVVDVAEVVSAVQKGVEFRGSSEQRIH